MKVVMSKRWSHMLNGYDMKVNGSASAPSIQVDPPLRLGPNSPSKRVFIYSSFDRFIAIYNTPEFIARSPPINSYLKNQANTHSYL